MILNPTASSLTTNSETFLYQTLQAIDEKVYELEKLSDLEYGEVCVVLECLRRVLGVLLTRERFRVSCWRNIVGECD